MLVTAEVENFMDVSLLGYFYVGWGKTRVIQTMFSTLFLGVLFLHRAG